MIQIACPEIKQEQPQDRKTHFETVSLPVTSHVAREVPTKLENPAFLSPLCSVLLPLHRIYYPYRNSLSEVFLVREGPLGGEGRGGTPDMVPLQNPKVTSRKACLRNAEIPT